MVKKLLIANRGEIACRVIKTARRMGIKTVAVYSDADASALHVQMADEAVRLGPPPAAESYLLGEKIIEACKAMDVTYVHPGYGFLSEREWFATRLAEEGITFVGPPPAAIAAMGDKIESKKLAKAAGVSVVPGFVGEIEDTDHAARIAGEIGYPVMMKASAGGGGKGMRLAFSEAELREGFDAVRREAKASFGDDRVFIEKFVEQPRHIEIQVLGDQHGNIVYLGERECSIQRRHQKVVEEAPSPFLTPEMRKAMGKQAVELARAVSYHSAGTVEFIVGADRSFYFLEMNTRLQVEHPVTELVTSLDLVELMIRVAAGEPLPFSQEDITLKGWAIETRVYAEDPYRGFLPSIGRLTICRPPENDDVVRVDTGVVEGSEISTHYDPMIAKLVTYGATRDDAIDHHIDALDDYVIRGINHNIDFLSAVLQHPRFREGRLTTGFIAEEYPDGFAGAPLSDAVLNRVAALATVVDRKEREAAAQINQRLTPHVPPGLEERVVLIGRQPFVTTIEHSSLSHNVTVSGEKFVINTGWQLGQPRLTAEVDGCLVAMSVEKRGTGYRLTGRGRMHDVQVLSPRAAELSDHMIEKVPPDLSNLLLCPMPGTIVSIAVNEGDRVETGQSLAIIEAMKMESCLRAEKSATVKRVAARAGDNLAVDTVILEFE